MGLDTPSVRLCSIHRYSFLLQIDWEAEATSRLDDVAIWGHSKASAKPFRRRTLCATQKERTRHVSRLTVIPSWTKGRPRGCLREEDGVVEGKAGTCRRPLVANPGRTPLLGHVHGNIVAGGNVYSMRDTTFKPILVEVHITKQRDVLVFIPYAARS